MTLPCDYIPTVIVSQFIQRVATSCNIQDAGCWKCKVPDEALKLEWEIAKAMECGDRRVDIGAAILLDWAVGLSTEESELTGDTGLQNWSLPIVIATGADRLKVDDPLVSKVKLLHPGSSASFL